MAIVTTKDLTFSYPESKNNALCGVSFSIEQGETVLIMGKSGSGKTTLTKLMKAELAPYGKAKGNICVNAKSVGYVMQNTDESIVADTVAAELAFGCHCKGFTEDVIELKIAEISSFFNIADLLNTPIASLSGGTKRLVALAAVMMDTPELIVLDEPAASLDPSSEDRFLSVLRRINSELGITVVMATHAPGEFYASADKVIMLEHGTVTACGSPQSVAKSLLKSKSDMALALPAAARLFGGDVLTAAAARTFAHKLKEQNAPSIKPPPAALKVKNIYFTYNKHTDDVLDSLSYTAYEGCINGVIGANGSGKTTMLKIASGVHRAYRGKIKLSGKISMMPQDVKYLFTGDTVADEITKETAQMLGILNILDSNPHDISGGQARLTALGMVLEQNADIIILDEPTQGIDAPSKVQLADILKALCGKGKTVIIATHDLDFIGRYADYIAFISSGRVCACADRRSALSSLDLYTTSVRRITRGFLNSAVSEDDLL